ncbi:MAG TPA: hypothetical protein VFA00_15940 [Actinomycetota bacterium]|nr:hypothetical protein [Actinomycetota bacterium]
MSRTSVDHEPAAHVPPTDPANSNKGLKDVGRAPSHSRFRTFRLIAAIMAVSGVAFGLFTAVFGIVSEAQEIHAFHNVVVAALLLVLSAPPAIAAARAPDRAAGPLLHLVAVSVAGLITMVLGLKVDIFTLPFIVLVGVLLMLRVPRGPALAAGRLSPSLAVLVAVAALPLVIYALTQAELQRIDISGEHAEFNHWVETSFYAVAVLLLGLMAAVRPAAYRLTAWCAGLGLAILGGASLALGHYASALDAPWAWGALLGGLVFVSVAEWERLRSLSSRA